MTEQQPERIMRVGDLASRPGVSVDGPSLHGDATLFRGTFWNKELRHGLFVHGSDVVEDEGFTALSSQQAGLSCVFFLEGDVEVRIGDRDLRFRGSGTLHDALVIPSVRAESFRRRSPGRQRIKHLVVSVTPEWLESDGLEGADDPRLAVSFASDHLASHAWRVTSRAAELVNRLFLPGPRSSRIGELYAESAAVEIVAEVLAASSGEGLPRKSATLAPRERVRLSRACDFIATHEGEWPSVEAVARQAGVSASGLQRLFRSAHGLSVFEYMRLARLERARDMLGAGQCTIQEAASLSGYSSAANFATAFRRQFGATPKQVLGKARP
ncbi:helix-turn-helix transcriptional regulator [Ollibium composti]|uniref:Helix-turn-helix transcriptional regulator n=1 Tax=Ollibium composti TaxID=2675109 RepID=A0ABY2Q4U2_9HYPH|nr:AraC family transcriptional regulator [Mesorhizobium composti]THF55317.1 helix-turn-helix transcriptional regulator [Mesorhizobium composti]